ncbi:Histidine kinase-, DNA gyrase B-, and HSP90-like ATPase [compost metagenome]
MIAIRARVQNGMLELVIEDDGAGMTEARLTALRNILEASTLTAEGIPRPAGELTMSGSTSSYGLRNVQERIRLSFGEPYGLSITSQEKVGTVVTMKHPVIHRKGDHTDEAKVEGIDRG